MDQKQLFREMLEFNKAAFDNNLKAMFLYQTQSEEYILRFLNSAVWIPEENRKMTMQWLEGYKKNYEHLKACADKNYRKIFDSLNGPKSQDAAKDKSFKS